MMRAFEVELQFASQRLEAFLKANRRLLGESGLESQMVVGRYAAAIAGNFIAWLGMTYPWLRHERARRVVLDNLRCDMGVNRRSVLLRFAKKCGAILGVDEYEHVAYHVGSVFNLLADPSLAGLRGLALLATLERLSLTFIPELARMAEECGCVDFTYIQSHNSASAAHSIALIEAVSDEMVVGYLSAETVVAEASRLAEDLINQIFSQD